jgi:gas vesicle protein
MSKIKRLAIGTSVIAAAGYVAGLLTAPKSGKETRAEIKQTVDSGRSEAEKTLKQLHTELDNILSDIKNKSDKASGKAKAEYEDLADKAGSAKQKTRELLSAIHEGDADDKDLKKAIKDASKAIDHLKSYLKK